MAPKRMIEKIYTSRQLLAIAILGSLLLLFYVSRYYLKSPKGLEKSAAADVWAEIKGDVVHPGLYNLESEKTRLSDLLEKAGGLKGEGITLNSETANTDVRYGDSWSIKVLPSGNVEAKRDKIRGARALAIGLKISINTATKDELLALPIMNEKTATRIVKYRDTNGPFTSFDQLRNVPGVTERRINRWEKYLSF